MNKWTKNKGDGCPVDWQQLVEVKFPDGSVYTEKAGNWDWEIKDPEDEDSIIEYRKVLTD